MGQPAIDMDRLSGVWSAAPTPLTDDMKVHTGDVKRMIEHHIRLGVKGLFLAGTNGEGPSLPERERRTLLRSVVEHAEGRLMIAMQVTDNSAARIMDNMEGALDGGADIAVIAPPDFFSNATAENLERHYIESIRQSPLPVGVYDRGNFGAISVPLSVLRAAYAEEKVVLIKDSSTMQDHAEAVMEARRSRPDNLRVLDGDEFNCVKYIAMGYDGLLLGGGVFNGHIAGRIIDAVKAGDIVLAESLQERMNRIMWDVYGGRDIACWLSGEKRLLVEMGILSTWKNHYNYPLSDSCVDAIMNVLKHDSDVLFP